MKSTDMIEERSDHEMTGTQNNEQDFSAALAPSLHFYQFWEPDQLPVTSIFGIKTQNNYHQNSGYLLLKVYFLPWQFTLW